MSDYNKNPRGFQATVAVFVMLVVAYLNIDPIWAFALNHWHDKTAAALFIMWLMLQMITVGRIVAGPQPHANQMGGVVHIITLLFLSWYLFIR